MTPLDTYRRLIERITSRDTFGRILIFKHKGRPIRYIREVLPEGNKNRVVVEVEYREWEFPEG